MVSNIFETHHLILIPIKIYFHGVKITLFYMFTSVPKKLFEKMASLRATISIEAMLNEDCNYNFYLPIMHQLDLKKHATMTWKASWALPSPQLLTHDIWYP
jgi:hypothetical protein